MYRKIAIGALHVAAAVLILSNQGVGAVAAAGAAVEGTGNISPGLTTAASAQSGSFGGTIVGAGALLRGAGLGAKAAVGGSCSFTFQSPAATIASQTGTAQGTCGGGTQIGGSGSIDCSALASLAFTRVGGVALVTGTCNGTINGQTVTGTVAAPLLIVPTSPSTTVTSFAFTGLAVAVSTQ